MILDEPTLRKLNQLTLVSTHVRAGVIKGERRSTKRGTSVEFADYREYSHGDDLRRLDWNVYARLEKPYIKLLEEEEDLAVHILLDASRSMNWGEGDVHKFQYAVHLAAALGAIALGGGDHMTAAILYAGDQAEQRSPLPCFGPARGQPALMRYLKFLEGITPSGITDLAGRLRDYALAPRRPGLVFVISDLFSPSGFQIGLSQLQSRGYEVSLLHLLSPDELDPPLAGDLRLVDIETGSARDVSLDNSLRDLYIRRVKVWQTEIAAYCLKREMRYLPVNTSFPWDKFVFYEMRKAGMIK